LGLQPRYRFVVQESRRYYQRQMFLIGNRPFARSSDWQDPRSPDLSVHIVHAVSAKTGTVAGWKRLMAYNWMNKGAQQ